MSPAPERPTRPGHQGGERVGEDHSPWGQARGQAFPPELCFALQSGRLERQGPLAFFSAHLRHVPGTLDARHTGWGKPAQLVSRLSCFLTVTLPVSQRLPLFPHLSFPLLMSCVSGFSCRETL